MANKVYWFNLPKTIKDRVEAAKASVACIDNDADVDAALAKISWFRLPERFVELYTVTNSKINSAPFVPSYDIKWYYSYKLLQEVEDYLNALDAATCA